MSEEQLNEWLGKQQTVRSYLSVETANLMQATLNRDGRFQNGDALPFLWHWLYFHETVSTDGLGEEGHPKLGGFMPPVTLPRRMWAGGSLRFLRPLQIGKHAEKRSTIASITPKQGRSGALCFVTIKHELFIDGDLCVEEEQNIVYREAAKKGDVAPTVPSAPTDGAFQSIYEPDARMLFRYSALTFNAHRIHYDVDFCRDNEGYPDLVVHGPLTATLLLDLFMRERPDQQVIAYTYRGRSPLFVPDSFSVNGKDDGTLWASNHEGGLAMTADVQTADGAS